MEKKRKKNFRLIGLKLGHKTTNENGQAGIDCGNLRQQFEAERISELIPNKVNNAVYAVYYGYEKDDTKPYCYFIGCQVDEISEIPESLSELAIPAQDYVMITAKGAMTGCISDAWREIWASNINRKFGFDFEVYDERSQDWNDAELDIFVSVNE